jgi:hypothetical protein
MKIPAPLIASFVLAATCLAPAIRAQSMSVDSLDGPVTQNEINSFKSYIQTIQPVVWPNTGSMENQYAQAASGEQIKAMGLMYEISQDTAILDRMIYFCDTLLSQRNDLLAAPNGQRTYWNGKISPAWPGQALGTTPVYSTSASGDCVGHLANCARLILQTPAIWNTSVAIGDPNGYGATYLLRAKTYVAQADYTFDQCFFPDMLTLTNSGLTNVYCYPAGYPYQPGNQYPWNQAMMMTYPLQNLAIAHAILGDSASRVSKYDGLVQTNIGRFFSDTTVRISYTDSAGRTAYNWAYNPSANNGEDSNHGALDVAGFYRAYETNRYGVTTTQMVPFGNMVCDVLTGTIGSYYHGRVDGTDGTGHAASTTNLRSGYFFAAEFRADQYYNMVSGLHITAPGTTSSSESFSRLMWIKNRRYVGAGDFTTAVSPSSQTVNAGGSTSYTATVSALSGFSGTVSLGVTGLPGGATASFSPTSINGAGTSTLTVTTSTSTAAGTSSLLITGTSGSLSHTVSASLVVNRPTVAAPTFSPAGGTYTTAQSVTISSSTSGASIRYTTDGSTPTSTTGTLYSAPVAVGSSLTLKAIAYASGMADSAVSSAAYTISTGSTTAINDADAGLVYAGTWTYSANRGLGDYSNDVHYTKINGDSVSYTFTGTGIDYVTEKNTDEGNVGMYIDGVLKQTVSCASTSRLVQQVVYSATGLTAGSHTFKAVKVDGTYMLFDELIVHTSATTTFTITASAGSNGSISPSGSVVVNQGASQSFTITPAAGYVVSSVTVDGTSAGAVTSYTFSNVQANHTISAAFTASAGDTNIAPSGTGYGWKANTTATANTNRTAMAGLNDNNLTTDVDLDSAGDAISAWEGAGVTWTTAKTISSAKFINGTVTTGGDGFLTANCKLQFSTDGSTWTDSGWTISPAYPNSSAASGQTYTFSGTAVSGKLGARVVGQVRTVDTSYHWIVKEVQFIGH